MLKISQQEKKNKAECEEAALRRLEQKFGASLPFVPSLLGRYEARTEPEARFVKAVDKIIPKTAHILNRGATLHAQDTTKTGAEKTYRQQGADLLEYADDFPEVLALREELVGRMLRIV